MPRLMLALTAIFLTLLTVGCSAPFVTNTPRSAVEQMLMCTVIERGIGNVDFANYKGKKAFIDYAVLAPQVDKDFVKAYLELHLAKNGISVMKDEAAAEITIQPSCGILATDIDKILVGTPTLPIPIPEFSISIIIPEIPLFMHLTRSGYGRFFFTIKDSATYQPLETIAGSNAYAEYNNWVILLIPFKSDNVKFHDNKAVPCDYTVIY